MERGGNRRRRCSLENTVTQSMPRGRLIVPSRFREQLGDEFVVTKGLDGCLFVYENSEWRSFEEKLHALPLTNANARKFTKVFSWPAPAPARWTGRAGS